MEKDAGTDLGVTQQVPNAGLYMAHLPTDPAEYAAVEKKLVRRIDTRLLPVLIAMIVLKYGFHTLSSHPEHLTWYFIANQALSPQLSRP
jgi:hypothetical protein